MTNRVVIGILLLLIVFSGAFGYYSFTLTQQIDSLSELLAVFQEEQARRIGNVSEGLMAIRDETMQGLNTLQGEIDEIENNMVRIDTLEGEIAEVGINIDEFESELGGTQVQIDNLEDEIGDAVAEFSQSAMNASRVYQKASQATVRISDGQDTIGSGFILDDEAHVATAYHVIENLSSIFVVLPDGRVSRATVTGSDSASDVAVLTLVDNLAIEPLPLADSAEVRIGEPVAAIGSPFDLTETLTVGIVSQTGRFVEIQSNSQNRWVANLIQFDAPVNFGNSGCPLINADGEVVGMVIARIGPEEGDGIYYAVSSNKVKRVTDAIIEQGFYDSPWIGVNVTALTPLSVQSRDLASVNGAVVSLVIAGSPAETTGIRIDDIIVAVDGVPVRGISDLISYLGEHKSPGDDTTVTVIRDTAELELSLEIGKRP